MIYKKCLIVRIVIYFSILPFSISGQHDQGQNILFQSLGDNYLGQQPPGMIPELFPPPELQSDSTWFWHGSPVFSPDLNEMYFTKYITQSNRTDIYFVKYENNQWTEPQIAFFSDTSYSDNNPFFITSKDTLYFQSSRHGGFIFRVTRTGDIWSQPTPLNIPIPAGCNPGLQFSISKNRTLYSELWENNNTDLNLYRWNFINGQYTQAEILTGSINTPQFDFMPFIDPDERFLLFCSDRSGGFGDIDLYISFKTDSMIWTEPKNLDTLFNTYTADTWPCISPDGMYLFFCTAREFGFNPYWIDAGILEDFGEKPYLNQNPPGSTPVLFAPSSMVNAYGIGFSPDGNELFYTRYDGQKNEIWHTKVENYQWLNHAAANFSGNFSELEPHISPDGQRLYFASMRPDSGATPSDTMHGWHCEKTLTGWTEPQRLPEPLTNWDMMFITEANNRNLYFTSPKPGGNGGELYVAKWNNGMYNEPERLSTQTINKFWHQAHPFIAPDESYIIYDASINPSADLDLYISFQNPDSTWGDAESIDAVNTSFHEGIAFVSRDGNYFFFSRNADLYWVVTEVISNLFTNVDRENSTDYFGHVFHLNQNYPNPFNPNTTISYSIPKTSLVNLIIYNILGKEIKTLVNEEIQPGNYEVEFDAGGLTSGIYFYRLRAGSFVEVRKMILLK